MKITAIYVYPIKSLGGIRLEAANLTAQGISHDRHFMLFKVLEDGELKKLQLASFPQCSLFDQVIDETGKDIIITYRCPEERLVPDHPMQHQSLRVPLEPDIVGLDEIDIDLHKSPTRARRMGSRYDEWFSACFGFSSILVHIGNGRREVLGSFAPNLARRQQQEMQQHKQQSSWLSTITSYLPGRSDSTLPEPQRDDWLTFTDCAPFLVTNNSSLKAVNTRLPPDSPVAMDKFRPNIVLDGAEEDEWSEDFWAELLVGGQHRFLLTANCIRCTSLNVDYSTGRPAVGESGTVLKKLMKDRRVDTGAKWSPVFGRYAFLANTEPFAVRVGDEAQVIKRNENRPVNDWPFGNKPKPQVNPS